MIRATTPNVSPKPLAMPQTIIGTPENVLAGSCVSVINDLQLNALEVMVITRNASAATARSKYQK